ncbi:winged helix-turn-helix domain-containing protein [Umezawaea sp. Da 62-37]|uniref:ArsR/SmtB family transcription factor n=1 Tax=Umezawaea sp. Da 62-37 TaxID=3075927 RepID=UPI0028F72BD3|nr:winged helix-turn-helix domain-containing protein [Umezawaea sp. Da 62-37]WNV86352.1 winged helix-turn-helix domain-containing protein [Umezawaea sp. Da 62-37]
MSSTGLSRSRFAISPFAETVGALIALQRASTEPWRGRGQAEPMAAYRAWTAADPVAGGLLALVATTRWFPDVVTVPPTGGLDTRLDQELADLAALPDDTVRGTIDDAVRESATRREPDWLPAVDLAARMAEVIEEGWRRFVSPTWARRRAVLEREITHRAGLVAAHGWQRAVTGMTRRSTWVEPDAIRFSDQSWDDVAIGDHGLTFVPYTGRQGSWVCERPPHYALVYPARGTASRLAGPPSDPLSILLGPGRARVAAELATPVTSSQLAASLDLSLGTVSAHLAVLRDAGVATGSRSGRNVFYRLTARGEALLALLGAGRVSDEDDRPS